MRQTAAKRDDLRIGQMSLNCCNQRLSELFGGKLTLLPKLDVVGSNPIARCES
ncbi:MAG: hypothetical protein HYR83_06495 [Planctomycetes bacterium]|nr:hypothetical protein [Planctomycetota bacterium]